MTSAKAEKTSKNNVKLVSQLKYPIKGMNRLGFHSNVVAVKEKIMKFFSGGLESKTPKVMKQKSKRILVLE